MINKKNKMLAKRVQNLGTETAFEVLMKAVMLEKQGKDIIHLHVGAPDFTTPHNIIEAGCKALKEGYHKYTPAGGYLQLKEAVQKEIAEHRNVNIPLERIMITPGGKLPMFYAPLLLGEEGREIMYPNPGFPIYESMIRFSGAKAIPMTLKEENNFSFDAKTVLEQVNKNTSLIIINTPSNPTGSVISRKEIEEFVKGIEKYPDLYILSDEIYGQIIYDNEEHVSLLEFESIRDRVILLDGWSKTYAMTGWRLGYSVWPAELVEHAERLQINSTSCPNAATQIAGIEALTGPQVEVSKMTEIFDKRRKIIYEELNNISGITCTLPKGAFYAFPNITNTGFSSKELENKLLYEANVACISGASFGKFGEGYLRFSYANNEKNILEAMKRIKKFLN